MMTRNEVLELIADSQDLISRIRVVLGTICIEAKSAQDVVSVDSALASLNGNLTKILTEYPPEDKE